MLKRLVIAALFLVTLLPASVSAMQVPISDTITLRGTVPVARYIYLDKNGDIDRVVGNTSDDSISPVIASQNPTPLTPKVISEYQAMLKANNGHMSAGTTYYPAPNNPYSQFAKLLMANSYFNSKPF